MLRRVPTANYWSKGAQTSAFCAVNRRVPSSSGKHVLGGAIAKRRIQLEHAHSHLAQIQICKNVPTELMFPQIVRKATDTDGYVAKLTESIQVAHNTARIKLGTSLRRMKRNYDVSVSFLTICGNIKSVGTLTSLPNISRLTVKPCLWGHPLFVANAGPIDFVTNSQNTEQHPLNFYCTFRPVHLPTAYMQLFVSCEFVVLYIDQ